MRIILKVANRQQDRNEELAEERTVEDTIAARVHARRTEARHQRERECHRQRRVAGNVHKNLVSEGAPGTLVWAGRWNKAAS